MVSTVTELVKVEKDDTELTSIQVRIAFREELKEMGKKGESYEDIIKRLLDHYKKTYKNNERK
jgi:hypothetical protein